MADKKKNSILEKKGRQEAWEKKKKKTNDAFFARTGGEAMWTKPGGTLATPVGLHAKRLNCRHVVFETSDRLVLTQTQPSEQTGNCFGRSGHLPDPEGPTHEEHFLHPNVDPKVEEKQETPNAEHVGI